MNSILELDARLSNHMRVAEKPGALRAIAVFFAHSGDSWFWALGLIVLWIAGVGGVTAAVMSETRYGTRLVNRIEGPGPEA